MYYSQACVGFVGSESTEADTTCDFEEEKSHKHGNQFVPFDVSHVHSDVVNFPVIENYSDV